MEAVYQLRVTLKNIKPPIWRQMLVPADFQLDQLHTLIQIAMGWQDSHLHEFEAQHPVTRDERTFTTADGVAESGFGEDERDIAVGELLIDVNDKMSYVYDFGDDWIHEVKVQKILSATPGENYPQCIGGKRACPPEDCGGPWRYDELLKSLAEPEDEEHEELLEWIGGDFDAEKFDLAAVQRVLAGGW